MNPTSLLGIAALALLAVNLQSAEDRDSRVRNDRADVVASGHWIYNDLPKGVAEARQSGKPLLVVLRCIP
jgi:hypothetical protein